jgi:hypothetical protein
MAKIEKIQVSTHKELSHQTKYQKADREINK